VADDEHVRGGRGLREIDDVRNAPSFFENLDDANGFRSDGFLRLIRACADVMRAVEIRFGFDFVREFACHRCRFVGVNIESGAQAPIVHRIDERSLIHDFAARSINEVRAFTHCVKKICADE
jgi:hypothetical protein